ncbi:MAG: hypothetical protein HY649_03125 [Acidobacteria bacterium]|nr:hypothetical protein [Acidobacteriota bacterium]
MMPLPADIQSKIAELEKEGWQMQFTTDEPRLSEAVELYESLGYEVRLEPACSELPLPECSTCYELFCEKYKTIFTRQVLNPETELGTELFP